MPNSEFLPPADGYGDEPLCRYGWINTVGWHDPLTGELKFVQVMTVEQEDSKC